MTMFLNRMVEVVHAINRRDFRRGAESLDSLTKWLEASGDWHRFYKESEVQGTLSCLRAFILVKQGCSRRLVREDGWEVLLRQARDELQRAAELQSSEDLDLESGRRGERRWQWERLAQQARQEMDRTEKDDPPAVCDCKFRKVVCDLHSGDRTGNLAREHTRYHNLVELEGWQSAEALLTEDIATDLEPYSSWGYT
ncbi:hypothetical protein BGZ61DRAFT_464573 [Ilyonectria robusta]|uniref:uncharacterized protein n=1 Tax=Ilyonectria robusta TaxID=1079257 RepID=UPI001E8DC99E|nr:uncharacterized protein BGZ61DRAFT_464573 [Ilyonectria robusta]KAH8661045.1 hypothetical protein BGZ61DRAFT_464573 [Ilyonectria robusta]